jgi:hypothetical protein
MIGQAVVAVPQAKIAILFSLPAGIIPAELVLADRPDPWQQCRGTTRQEQSQAHAPEQ